MFTKLFTNVERSHRGGNVSNVDAVQVLHLVREINAIQTLQPCKVGVAICPAHTRYAALTSNSYGSRR